MKLIFVFLNLIIFVYCEPLYGELLNKSDIIDHLYDYFNQNKSVCYFQNSDELNTTIYFSISNDVDFMLNHINEYIFNNITYFVDGQVRCIVDIDNFTEEFIDSEDTYDLTCGMRYPEKLSECIQHSTHSVSCCYMKDKIGDSNCIKNSKVINILNYDVFNRYNIECASLYISLSKYIFIIFIAFI